MSALICSKYVTLHQSDFLKDDVDENISNAKIVFIKDAFESISGVQKFITKNAARGFNNVVVLHCYVSNLPTINDIETFKLQLDAPQIIQIAHFRVNSWIYYRSNENQELKLFVRQPKINHFSSEGMFCMNFNKLVSFLLPDHQTSPPNDLFSIRVDTSDCFGRKRLIDYAVEASEILCIKFLKLFNVDLEVVNDEGMRPMEIAVERGDKKAFLTLLDSNSLSDLTEIKDNKIIKLMSLTQEVTGLNLLMIAISSGCKKVVKFMLFHQFVDINYEVEGGVSAASIAIGKEDFKTLYLLLQNNAKIPPSLNVNAENCPKYIKYLVESTIKVHKHIARNNKSRVKEIIRQYPNLRHFYNLKGESAVAVAIEFYNIEIYELLISNGITLSKDEDIKILIDSFGLQRKVRDVNRTHLKIPYEAHITRLLEHSRVGHDVSESLKQKYAQSIHDAIRQLSSAQEIDILFQVVTTADFLKLIFEFNRSTVDQIDPMTDKSTLGVTYLNGWIYIGTKGLKVGSTEEEKAIALGTIAHEICHFAMHLTFENLAQPFKEGDNVKEEEFQAIVEEYDSIYKQGNLEEKIISRVFECYSQPSWCAELIVRIPEICAFYMNNPVKLNQLRQKHHKLFTFYFQVMEDMKQIVSGHSAIKTIKLINDVVGVKQEISKTSDKTSLRTNFQHPTIENLPVCKIIHSNCPILTAKHVIERANFKNSILVKIESLKIDRINELVKEVYDQDKIKPNLIVISENNISNRELKLLRKIYKENLTIIVNGEFPASDEILTYQIEYKFSDLTTQSKKEFRKNILLFQGLEVEVNKLFLDFDTPAFNELPLRKLLNNEEITIGKELQSYDRFYYDRSFIDNMKNLLTVQDVINEKIILLSDEPGMGKSTTFKKIALKLKKEFPLKWVLYIDLKLYFASFNTFKNVEEWTTKDLVELFSHKFNFNHLDKAVFNAKLCSKQAILLFDGVDEISPDYKEFIVKLIHQIYLLTQNQLWIASRPHCVREIKDILNIQCYKLSNIDQDEFIVEFFKANQTKREEQTLISKFIEKMRIEWDEEYNNPLLIMIAIQIHKELNGDDNLYTFYEKFVNKKFKIIISDQCSVFDKNLGKGDLRRDDLIERRYKVDKYYEKIAIKQLLDIIQKNSYKFDQLEILKINSSELGIDAIFGFGILYGDSYENCHFVHLTLAEFFTSKFLVQNVIENISCDVEEKVLRLEFFWIILVDENYKHIQRFIEFYLQKNTLNNCNPSICTYFNNKIQEHCDEFKDTLQDFPREDSKTYFFYHIFMHLVVYKYHKTVEFLRNVCKVKQTKLNDLDQSSSLLQNVDWNFTLKFFDRELGKEMLTSFLLMRDSLHFKFKISCFLTAIKFLHGQHLSSFLNLINNTFDKEEINVILSHNNLDVLKYTELLIESKSRPFDDFKVFLSFVQRNYESMVNDVMNLILTSFHNSIDVFTKLLNSFHCKLSCEEKKKMIVDFIELLENPADLMMVWKNDLKSLIHETSDGPLLESFLKKLNKHSSNVFENPAISDAWLNDENLADNTKVLKEVFNSKDIAKVLNYNEELFLELKLIDDFILNSGRGTSVKLFEFVLILSPNLVDSIAINCLNLIKDHQNIIHGIFEQVWCMAKLLDKPHKLKIFHAIIESIQNINEESFKSLWEILQSFLDDKSVVVKFLLLSNDEKEYPMLDFVLKNLNPDELSKLLSEKMFKNETANDSSIFERIFKCINPSLVNLLTNPNQQTAFSKNFLNFLSFIISNFDSQPVELKLISLIQKIINTNTRDVMSSKNLLWFLKNTLSKSILSESAVKCICGSINLKHSWNLTLKIFKTFDIESLYATVKPSNDNYLKYLNDDDKMNVMRVEFMILTQQFLINEFNMENATFLKEIFKENSNLEQIFLICLKNFIRLDNSIEKLKKIVEDLDEILRIESKSSILMHYFEVTSYSIENYDPWLLKTMQKTLNLNDQKRTVEGFIRDIFTNIYINHEIIDSFKAIIYIYLTKAEIKELLTCNESSETHGWNLVQFSILQQLNLKIFSFIPYKLFDDADIKSALITPNKTLTGKSILTEIFEFALKHSKKVEGIVRFIFSYLSKNKQQILLTQSVLMQKNALQLLPQIIEIENVQFFTKINKKFATFRFRIDEN